jgi:hypothetical protein
MEKTFSYCIVIAISFPTITSPLFPDTEDGEKEIK